MAKLIAASQIAGLIPAQNKYLYGPQIPGLGFLHVFLDFKYVRTTIQDLPLATFY